jgi:tetratricopeptide (TPR) repeat protein
MRLPWPFSKGGALEGAQTPAAASSNRLKKLWPVLPVVILVIAAVVGIALLRHHNYKKHVNETPSDSNIELYQGSSNLQERRIVANAYIDKADYDKAVDLLKDIASKSNDDGDYATILNICVNYTVSDKQGCIDYVVSKTESQIPTMKFGNAYSLGSLLDQAKQNKSAVKYYQRALVTYDAKLVDKQTMTQDQLKARIAMLEK